MTKVKRFCEIRTAGSTNNTRCRVAGVELKKNDKCIGEIGNMFIFVDIAVSDRQLM